MASSWVYPVQKQTILREKKEFTQGQRKSIYFCLFIINILVVVVLLNLYKSNQYLEELTTMTKDFKADVDHLGSLHRLLLNKLRAQDKHHVLEELEIIANSTDKTVLLNVK